MASEARRRGLGPLLARLSPSWSRCRVITALSFDPGKRLAGHATVRATHVDSRITMTWIGGGHAEPTPALLDSVIDEAARTGDELLTAVEEVREAFPGAHAGDLIATGKQEQRIFDHLERSPDIAPPDVVSIPVPPGTKIRCVARHPPQRIQATVWRKALTGTSGPSDEAIAIAVCGIVHGLAEAPLGKSEREHAIDAAGLAVYVLAQHLGLLTPLGRIPLPRHVEAALAEQLLKDKGTQKAKREAKKLKKAGLLPAAARRRARRA